MPTPRFHHFVVAGVTLDLPIVPSSKPGISIAVFDILDKVDQAEIFGVALAQRIPDSVEVIMSVEGKAMALAHVVAREKNKPLVTIRKGDPKPYAIGPVILKPATTITTGSQKYWTESKKLSLLHGKKVAVVDDVVSTGNTLRMLIDTIISLGEGRFTSAYCVLTEGDNPLKGVVALGHLPLFRD